VRLVSEQLNKAEGKYGSNSKQADQLRITLNNATTAMNGTKEKIGQTETSLDKMEKAVADTGDESAEYTLTLKDVEKAEKNTAESTDDAKESTDEYKKSLSGVGDAIKCGLMATLEAAGAAFIAVGAAAAAAAKQAFDMAVGAGIYADDLLTLSTQTGISVDALQKWSYAANFIDTDVSTMTGSMAKMVKQMGAAAGGSETAAAKFSTLGVSITDSSGGLRDSEDVFMDAIDALGKVPMKPSATRWPWTCLARAPKNSTR
jgi:hypothetical protein